MAFFAAMTAVLVGNNLMSFEPEAPEPLDASTLLVISARLLWRIHLAWAIIGFVRIYLVLAGARHGGRPLGTACVVDA